jgi:hypothetical protein
MEREAIRERQRERAPSLLIKKKGIILWGNKDLHNMIPFFKKENKKRSVGVWLVFGVCVEREEREEDISFL